MLALRERQRESAQTRLGHSALYESTTGAHKTEERRSSELTGVPGPRGGFHAGDLSPPVPPSDLP